MTSKPHAFLMNCWYVAAWGHELIDGRLLARTILGQPVVLYFRRTLDRLSEEEREQVANAV